MAHQIPYPVSFFRHPINQNVSSASASFKRQDNAPAVRAPGEFVNVRRSAPDDEGDAAGVADRHRRYTDSEKREHTMSYRRETLGFPSKLLIKMVGTTGLEPGTSSVSKQPHQQIQQLTSGYGKCQVPASKWKNLGGLRFLGWDLGRTVSVRRDEVGAAASGQSTTGLRRLPLSRSADLCTIENVAANIARSQTLKLLKPQPSPEARCRRKLCAKEPCRHRIPSPFRRGPGVFDASVLYHS